MFRLVVLSVVLAVAAAKPNGVWGAGLANPLAAGWGAPWAAGVATPWAASIATPIGVSTPLGSPLVASVAVASPIGGSNYRGPLSLAPGQPANILAADGRPLDTLSVNLDRAVHATAKAVEGRGHWLKKRSIVAAPLAAAPWASLNAAPLAWGRSWAAPAPVAVAAAPIAPWGLGVGARVGLW